MRYILYLWMYVYMNVGMYVYVVGICMCLHICIYVCMFVHMYAWYLTVPCTLYTCRVSKYKFVCKMAKGHLRVRAASKMIIISFKSCGIFFEDRWLRIGHNLQLQPV